MADKKEDKQSGEAAAGPSKKNGGKLLFIILPIVGAVAGIGASMAFPKPPSNHAHAQTDQQEEYLDFMVPEIKANLARSGGLHYCAVDIHIRIKSRDMGKTAKRLGLTFSGGGGADGGHGGGGGKNAAIQPLTGNFEAGARDRIILLLNAKSIDDLEGREKKELLKREIKEELNEVLFQQDDGEIDSVLFKDIMIQ
ncbi:MAG: flagellar basal body-associated protein FliL [Planctomycetota bacterium]